jgi:hypothetical protein
MVFYQTAEIVKIVSLVKSIPPISKGLILCTIWSGVSMNGPFAAIQIVFCLDGNFFLSSEYKFSSFLWNVLQNLNHLNN